MYLLKITCQNNNAAYVLDLLSVEIQIYKEISKSIIQLNIVYVNCGIFHQLF